ncbi:hypothetical protein RBSH_01616 [Rhodopirellula baltica SH28]|uniref:Uncharacterized protein n=1 Tax=Rhodopirellula baltica SH28 TaxID=993517 RepID=K5DKD2_RHOBT|nr:hypothetical protein [Rhodopirellula baltica]EKK02923.1 hypothetical protein RBSH_01616 [Rhodopirellula baltica SH28]
MNIDEWKAEQELLAIEYANADLAPEIAAFLTSWEPDESKVGDYAEWAKEVAPVLKELEAELAKPQAELDEESIAAIQDDLADVLSQLGVNPAKKKRGVRLGLADNADAFSDLVRDRVMVHRVTRQIARVAGNELARDVVPVVRSEMDTDTDVEDKKDHKPLNDIDRLILRAANEGIDCWTSHDHKMMVKYSQQKAKEIAKEEAAATVERLAHELFPELKADQNVTAKRLTTCFAKRANPSDGSDPKPVDDAMKLKFVELTRAWKAAGGSIEYDSQSVRVELKSTSGGNHEQRFMVGLSKKGTHPVTSSVSLPALTFQDKM